MDSQATAGFVDAIRRAPLDILTQSASALINNHRLPAHNFLASLNEQDRADALRACLILAYLTRGRVVPRIFQLQATLALLNRHDCVVIAGTGSGKTLCLLIPILLRPDTITITISPLKRLQITQVNESEQYGIKTIAINEDTPHDEALWKSIRDGHFQHLIISPEQLGPISGHLPRLARILRENRSFTQKIAYIHVDEAHNIHTAGLSHYGEDAFRPAYGKIGSLRALLPRGIPFQALSATLPNNILATVKQHLGISAHSLELRLSSNRPNITYATIPIIGSLRNFENLRLLVPSVFHPPMIIPKTLVFHDSKQDATDAARFIESNLPQCLRNHGLVKHYHSDMSTEYLQQTFESFSDPNGDCRILHATAGAATGLDIPGVCIIIQYGICKNMTDTIQRAGRAVRDGISSGLFLTMVESWVLQLKVDSAMPNDPDEPYAGTSKKNSSKHNRTSIASLQYVQCRTCLRKFLVDYLGDTSPEGDYITDDLLTNTELVIATQFTALWCCDRHDSTNFNISTFFHGTLCGDDLSTDRNSRPSKRGRNQLRPTADRQPLHDKLTAWRDNNQKEDPFFPISWFLDDESLDLISKTHPEKLQSVKDLVDLLGETDEWAGEYGGEIFNVIQEFDRSVLACQPPASYNQRPMKRPAKGIRTAGTGVVTFLAVETPETYSCK